VDRDRFRSLLRPIPPSECVRATHNLHPYPGKFLPHFPRMFIEGLTQPGELVVDPMAGAGTTLVEAALLNRPAVGLEIDPLASRIARVATTPLSGDELNDMAGRLFPLLEPSGARGRAVAATALPSARDFPNHDLWFRPEVLRELIYIREVIGDRLPVGPGRDFAELCLSSVVRPVSNADPRDIFPERDRECPVRPRRDPFGLFRAAWDETASKVAAFAAEARAVARVESSDAREPWPHVSPGSAALVFTSPPYAYALDYARVGRLSTLLLWLSAPELRRLRCRYLGDDRAPVRDAPRPDYEGFEFAREAIERVYGLDRKWGVVLHRYVLGMRRVARRAAAALRPGGHLVWVVGNSTLKRTTFRTDEVMAALSEAAGLEVVDRLQRPYYMYRMARRRNVQSNTIKADVFIVCRRG